MFYYLLFHTLVPLFGLRLKKVAGRENVPFRTPFIIAANHINWFDPLVLLAGLKPCLKTQVHFIAKTNNYWWLGAIPIDKNNKGKCLLRAADYLKKNKLVAIFPEGQRMSEVEVNQGKVGVAKLTLLTKTPVLPVGISGPRGRNLFQTITSFFKGPRPFSVSIGQPLKFKEYYGQEMNREILKEITGRVMRELLALAQNN